MSGRRPAAALDRLADAAALAARAHADAECAARFRGDDDWQGVQLSASLLAERARELADAAVAVERAAAAKRSKATGVPRVELLDVVRELTRTTVARQAREDRAARRAPVLAAGPVRLRPRRRAGSVR